MTHELNSSGWPHYQENLHALIFKIQSANQSAPALLSPHVSLRVGSFPAPLSLAACGDGTTCSVMETCCELVVRSNQSLQQVESWLKCHRTDLTKAAEQNEDYRHKLLFKMWSTSLSTGRETKWREAITHSFIVRVYILWFINVFKRGCTSFHAHTHALPAQASSLIDDYSGCLVCF